MAATREATSQAHELAAMVCHSLEHQTIALAAVVVLSFIRKHAWRHKPADDAINAARGWNATVEIELLLRFLHIEFKRNCLARPQAQVQTADANLAKNDCLSHVLAEHANATRLCVAAATCLHRCNRYASKHDAHELQRT